MINDEENGPFVPNFNGGLDLAPLSWNRIANVLYVEVSKEKRRKKGKEKEEREEKEEIRIKEGRRGGK